MNKRERRALHNDLARAQIVAAEAGDLARRAFETADAAADRIAEIIDKIERETGDD